MSRLSPEERQRFVDAASAMIAKQEKLELMTEQAKEQLGGVPGRVPIPQSQVNDIMAPGRELMQVLADLRNVHPDVRAIRFRGRIITMTEGGGRVGLRIIKESDIEDVAG
jgi:hypothetical protein